MKKRFIIGIIITALLALATSIILIISLNDEKDAKNKDIISLEEFSSILIDFDTTNNMTIEKNNSNDESSLTIKLDQNKYMIKLNDLKEEYFHKSNDKIYNFYFENNKWKRKEFKEEFKYDLNLNLKKYINSFSQFTYDSNEEKYILNEYIDEETYTNIWLKFVDGVVREYSYTSSTITYTYKITYYKNTSVVLPEDYTDVYEMLRYDEFDDLDNSLNSISNFTATIVYVDKIDNEEYETKAIVQKNDGAKQYQYFTSASGTNRYYNEINGIEKRFYTFEDDEWKLLRVETTADLTFNQKALIPLYLIKENYDKIVYNEIDANYCIENVISGDFIYDEITFEFTGKHITYISMMYTYKADNLTHNVTHIIEFSDFNNTKIDNVEIS